MKASPSQEVGRGRAYFASMDDTRTLQTVMEGKAFYNRNSEPQRLVGELATPQFLTAARDTALPTSRPFVIVDYGSSQGANSLGPVSAAIGAVRQRAQVPIQVHHVDLPSNDFTALFLAVQKSPDSYIGRYPDVYYGAIGRSFYEAVMPPESVNLGWSANAIHWLQTVPCLVIEHIWPHGGNENERRQFALAADKDWRRFLDRRAIEMAPGARLLVSGGTYDAAEAPGPEVALDILNDILRDMMSDGALNAAEYVRFVLPTVFRTAEDFRAPFGDSGYVSSRGLRLRMLSLEAVDVPQIMLDKFSGDRDARGYGRALSNFVRAFTAPVLRQQLDSSRTPEELETIVDTLFNRAAERYAADPEMVEPRWRQLILSIASD